MSPQRGCSVAIIGASLTGLSLALSLLQNELCSPEDMTIFDLRAPEVPDPANASGVVLTPNGLAVLDSFGVLSRFRHLCWLSEYRTFKNDRDETVRKTLIANESLYGYKNHRVWRKTILEALLAAVQERNVSIKWQARFEKVVREDDHGVSFTVNGGEETADMLFGADGIHSTVRKYLDFGASPEYTGVTSVLSHIKRDEVRWPYESYEKACTIQGQSGALIMMPEDPEGSVVMVGKQVKMEPKSRQEWEEYGTHKDLLCQFYREGYEEWGPTAKQIIDAVCRSPETLYMWPFMRMAKLKRWFSGKGKTIIMGDAAHALPPSSGQGVSQALEDVDSLTKLLRSGKKLTRALEFWQEMRQQRIDTIFDWATNATNVQRLPQADRDRLVREGKAKDANATENFDDMRWLYQPQVDQAIDAWLKMSG
ncbi:hypothetical protein LTR10_013365 [Elasticomyces elasticus]|uniref:FAD-binding domain-containing protein n=1 Tax=Exophiala sideris TaxID=1016849 RepID=A0ABR0J4K6_9EURO|nr:hypothetical protein LTR10_013365 [Elasticomyces elasticus]KAK5027406.1 hypothetical protein LTS07_007008 [Exophiala sideris]KAK5034892.1 hypothetical protein LTR13_006074 [Exophiala sideris]KAK5056374.1 hypothetical protein LTR69_007915 [Exophiala sideris]KAK5181137.1 hypothetical protein LTR44_006468 [Eurotiomycetes sp. CCFEE 6388]